MPGLLGGAPVHVTRVQEVSQGVKLLPLFGSLAVRDVEANGGPVDLKAGSASPTPETIIVRDLDRDAVVRVKISIEHPQFPGTVPMAAFWLRLLWSEGQVVVDKLTHLNKKRADATC